jgi:predicted AlkP superfamily pyrophosphatase or phosphodiesterase
VYCPAEIMPFGRFFQDYDTFTPDLRRWMEPIQELTHFMTDKYPLLLLVVLAGCLGGCATLAPATSRTRTALVTFDGASDEYIDRLREERQLAPDGFFAQAIAKGYVAQQLTPINIANTGPSHAALFSGAAPSVSGIVGQNFATPQDALPKGANPFTYISDAETIVAAARRQGKRTVCFAAPAMDGRTPNYTCDYLLSFIDSSVESKVIKFAPFAEESQASNGPGSFGTGAMILAPTGRREALPLALAENGIQFLVADRNLDDAQKYDTLSIRYPDGTIEIIEPNRIYPFRWIEDALPGTNALWLNKLDPQSGEAELYWGQPYKTLANPAMTDAVISKLGPWPGALDAKGLHAGRISEAGFDALNEYQAKYTIDAMALLLKRKDWDLYLGYISYLDTVQHKYLVTSPLQIDHADKAERYAAKIKNAYIKLDGWMGEVVRSPDAANTNFLVASDHGMVPTHTVVAISSLIESWGYSVGGNSPDIGVYTSGASAHIYVNGNDRPGGHFTLERKSQIVTDLLNRFATLKDPSGAKVFAVVGSKAAISDLQLAHPGNAGDLFISAKAGFGLEPRKPPTARLFFPISFDRQALSKAGLTPLEVDFVASGFMNQSSPGVHGHVASAAGIAAIFYGIGPQVPKAEGPSADMLQVTPTVACLLGIQPPVTAQTKPVTGFCD